ncbi:hypothetical protein CTAYLR_001289 [Chrysophaeum taylorii]|uniref:Pyridoxamine 5'-phosphate oxidase family protein n=1 Tax=Chrysophaeum taylorii TaxID=2483200 RepID=A0AAD7UDC5_9STRA|nr:hypothetical protein CTAYLR_001289 [Chrysophaeum taylorii]
MCSFTPNPRSKVKRGAKRAVFDRERVYAILDANMVASIAFANDGDETFTAPSEAGAGVYPTVLPTGYVRDGDSLLFHGKNSSLLQKRLAAGVPVCVSVFALDALVCGKSAMHHSVNYRAVVVYGRAEPVLVDAEKRRALEVITDGLTWPGRFAECRPMNAAEVAATLVTRLSLRDGDVSCKVREHPPSDDDADLAYPCWAGNVPLRTVSLTPLDAPHNNSGIVPPTAAAPLTRKGLVTPLAVLAKDELKATTKVPLTSELAFWRTVALALAALLVAIVLSRP